MLRNDERVSHRVTDDDLRDPATRLVNIEPVRQLVQRVLETMA